MQIKVKRVYAPPASADGIRILVDRLWPRGLAKDKAAIDHWLKDLAPSNELRRWFNHEPARWPEFKQRYFAELDGKANLLANFLANLTADTCTLLYAAKSEYNNAVAMKEYIEKRK